MSDVYKTFKFDLPYPARPQPEFDFARVNIFDANFLSKHNKLNLRYIFLFHMEQPEAQLELFFDGFVKLKVRNCKYGTKKDNTIRDRIVCGIHDEKALIDILKLKVVNVSLFFMKQLSSG